MFYESQYFGICNLGETIAHYGIRGMKWGVKNGPPYPLDRTTAAKVRMKAKHHPSSAKITKAKNLVNSIENRKQEAIEDLPRLGLFDKKIDAMKSANKLNGDDPYGHDYNCPNTTMAFEMIERGYNVGARPKMPGSNVEDIESFFVNGKGKLKAQNQNALGETYEKLYKDYEKLQFPVGYTQEEIASEKFREAFDESYEKMWKELDRARTETRDKTISNLKSMGKGSRGIIVVGWMMDENPKVNTHCYHAFNWKVDKDGVNFYDIQGNDPWKFDGNYTDFFDEIDPRELYTMRTDNLELAPSATRAVYGKKGKKS